MKRKVLILFPYLENYLNNIDKRNKILELRRELNLIVSRVSDTLKLLMYREINELNNIYDISRYPDIELCISSIHDEDPTSGVRVCLTKYNDYDFLEEINFTKRDLKNKDVSHFVELDINDGQTKLKWEESKYKDSNGETLFDSKLKSNVGNLYYALLSIMIDIYAYYIVGLYGDYKYRADFSRLKIDNIKTRNNSNEIRNTYGVPRKDDLIKLRYLPISLLFNPTSVNLRLKETIAKYSEIIQDNILDANTIKVENKKLSHITNSSYYQKKDIEIIIDSFDYINEKNINYSDYNYIGIYFTEETKAEIEKTFKSILCKQNKMVYKKGCAYFLCQDSVSDNIPLFSGLYWFTLETNL